MPYAVVEFQATPNPNALKCVLDRPVAGGSGGLRSFRSAAEAASDPVGAALFAVPGVATVLIAGGWITVNKTPGADWAKVKRGVGLALAGAD